MRLRGRGSGQWALGLVQDFTRTHPGHGLKAERKCRSLPGQHSCSTLGPFQLVLTVSGWGRRWPSGLAADRGPLPFG